MPYCSKIISYFCALAGKKAKRTFEPSSGGMGNKLKIPNAILIKIITSKNNNNEVFAKNNKSMIFKIALKTIAIAKLLAGPAKPIKPLSFFGFFNLYGLKGTGFAQPNKNGLFIK